MTQQTFASLRLLFMQARAVRPVFLAPESSLIPPPPPHSSLSSLPSLPNLPSPLFSQIADEVNERRRLRESRNKVVLIQGRMQVLSTMSRHISNRYSVVLRQFQGMPSNHTLVIPGRCYLNHRVFVQQQGARGSRTLFLFNDGDDGGDDDDAHDRTNNVAQP